MRRLRNGIALAANLGALAALSACDSAGGSAPGAVSEGEAQELQDAAEMLDERQLPDGVLPPIGIEDASALDESARQTETPQEADSE